MSAGPKRPAAGENAAATPGGAIVEDALLRGRVRLRQPGTGYRVAIDSVFLAAAVSAGPDTRALDLGCGVGAAALCLLAREPQAHVVGLEIQPALAALARENAVLNGCADRFEVLQGDLAGPLELGPGSFDEVLCNPPYQPAAAATASPDRAKTLATLESATDLDDWLAAALKFARAKGGLTFVYRADRLDDLLAALHGKAGGAVAFPLWPGQGKAAKRVIVRARKGIKTPMRLAPGLTLHDSQGRFTAAAEAVLRDGRPLDL